VGIIVRLPLASGLLSGKYSKETKFTTQDHRNYNRDGKAFFVGETFSGLPFERGVELAGELKNLMPKGMKMSQFALRWLLDQPAVSTIIAGVTKPAQLVDNVEATKRDPLDPELHEELRDWYERKVRPHVRGHI
jgi:aryl-alcohol dehydrogenase-like predicted oxidoreductase